MVNVGGGGGVGGGVLSILICYILYIVSRSCCI